MERVEMAEDVKRPNKETGQCDDTKTATAGVSAAVSKKRPSNLTLCWWNLKYYTYWILSALGCTYELNLVGSTIILCILLIVPFVMIIVGAMFLHDCPVEHYIPVYLIVGGIFGLLKLLTTLTKLIWGVKHQNRQEPDIIQNPFDAILVCFLMAWFIAGCVWIFGLHKRGFNSVNPDNEEYCHPTFFWLAFRIMIANCILFAAVFLRFCVQLITIVWVLLTLNDDED
eukprot:GHVU01218123.1.p1 GENE.GHVU01218123.1~~GHVU01218123.1.p1  ORF type:complete len:227 (+),score=7.43 GHVU01218123.1:258-938(+)